MTKTMILTGDNNIPALPMTDAQVNHLRRLLAWMECEFMLGKDRQRGMITAVMKCRDLGIATGREARELLREKAEQVNQVPAYVRQAHKMLSKALQEHDRQAGVVETRRSDENLQAMPAREKPAGAAGAEILPNIKKEKGT
ncbi:hypothetical protein [Comamonas sp.]|uniref:hypothetical protein n=1 Tax=Comamonas sp. TaxID=34028 RepID=UPI00289B47DF|nr:hypothetical protein [Comamonas sp.]